jgi:hypothetical protein
MKTMLGLVLAAGLGLGGVSMAHAAPFTTAAPQTAEAAASLNAALTSEVGWRHHRRYHRHVHRHWGHHRPVYYHRPVRYRPRCFIRHRRQVTWDGFVVVRPVRVCRW